MLVLLSLLISVNVQAELPTVTPYRPTVSNPAELSALNHFEFELGTQFNQPGMIEEQYSLPFLLKYAFLENWGILVGGEAWIKAENAEHVDSSFGNTTLLLKYYHPLSSTLAFGIEGGVILPSAAKPLGTGRTDYSGTLIISQDIADLRVDLNIGVIRQGFHTKEHDRYKYNWALAASHPLSGHWGIAGEFSGVLGSQQETSSQWLMALNYTVNRQLVLDFGGSVGLTTNSDDYGAFAGFSFLFDS
ncbi:transporter [Methyloglobulus sp.]|uniref:transporter n=1 Tax=Methyloglobulus sp. TaxID=2518622 RepID=UPI003989D7B9